VNFSLAALAVLALRAGLEMEGALGTLLRATAGMAIGTNCVLGVLNLLPILPLDGGRVLAAILPRSLALPYARLERYGLLIVLVLLSQTAILSTLVRPVVRTFVSVGTAGLGAGR
jgi:Zn-dependent protease